MKKSELRTIIIEEIKKILKESILTDKNKIQKKYDNNDYGFYVNINGKSPVVWIVYSRNEKEVYDFIKNKIGALPTEKPNKWEKYEVNEITSQGSNIFTW